MIDLIFLMKLKIEFLHQLFFIFMLEVQFTCYFVIMHRRWWWSTLLLLPILFLLSIYIIYSVENHISTFNNLSLINFVLILKLRLSRLLSFYMCLLIRLKLINHLRNFRDIWLFNIDLLILVILSFSGKDHWELYLLSRILILLLNLILALPQFDLAYFLFIVFLI